AAYVLQFKDTARYLFHLKSLARLELSYPLALLAASGFLLALRDAVRDKLRICRSLWRREPAEVPAQMLLLAWSLPYFLFIGSWKVKFVRYMIPLLPTLAMFAGLCAARLLQSKWKRLAVPTVAMLAFLTAVHALGFGSIYSANHPWIESSI